MAENFYYGTGRRKSAVARVFMKRGTGNIAVSYTHLDVYKRQTSDFMADGIFLWWEERKQDLSGVKQLVVNLDNGPECNGHRSQFLLRMTEFADTSGLCVRLIYYPPYHSKYNAIERYWAGLEKSWNCLLYTSRCV